MTLTINKVYKSYKEKKVFQGLTIQFEKGICGLLGPNGAGKSTMIRMICGLEAPDQGQIHFQGAPIEQLGEIYRDKLGYVPQKAGYYPDFSAYRFLEYMAKLKDVSNVKEKIMEVLIEVGLVEEKDCTLRKYSGGMLQRVNIAQCLLNDPEILILDEPTVGLDPNERLRFKNLISSMSDHKTILFATHIVSDVEDIATRVVILKQGQIKADGDTQVILKSVQDMVWEYQTDSFEEVNQLKKEMLVSSVKNTKGMTTVRIISERIPCEKAIKAEPSLEEAYLFFCEGGV